MITVVAYGNPLRGDDGVAWRVAQALEHTEGGAVALTLHQLTPEVALLVSQADGVIFVDAARGARPGLVTATEIGPAVTPAPLTHHMDPETLLALAQRLYGSCPRAALVTVAGEAFDFSEELSAVVRGAIPEAARAVRQIVRTWSLSASPEGTAASPPRIPHA